MLAGRYAKNWGAQKVLVVTDPGLLAAGWAQQVSESLEAAGINYITYSHVTPNPRDEEVMSGARVYRSEGCNAIVAVGGGSVMDCAKGIGIVSSNNKHVLEFEGVDEVEVPGPPLICVPTTAGSSADVSQFAIITDTTRKVKISIVSKSVVPDVALIDPKTTTTMDAELTACTGVDALVHAVEAYVSDAQSPITNLHALEAVRLVTQNIEAAMRRPDDIALRGRMMLGSLHAGLAFSNASLGAVHAMAHSLGGFLDSPHGEANAILLGPVIDFNYDAAAGRYSDIGRAMGLRNVGKENIIREVSRIQKSVGVYRTLAEIGVRTSDIPALANKAMADACMVTNPRKPVQRDIEVILEQAL